jgi:hypothetical protein
MVKHGVAPYLECSSKGDKRFSAFYARIKAKKNKSIEELYQAFKIFDDGSTGLDWREAKGRKCVNQKVLTFHITPKYRQPYKGLVAAITDLGNMDWNSAKTACEELPIFRSNMKC